MDLFYSDKPPEINEVNLSAALFQSRIYSDMNGGKRELIVHVDVSEWYVLLLFFWLVSYYINHHRCKFPAVVPPYLDIVFSVCLNSPS